MCNENKKCSAWISLESIGILSHGCLRDPKWLDSITIPCNQSISNQKLYIDLPTKKLTCIKNVAHGKFGYIDLARYDTQFTRTDVYVKRPIISGKSLLYEACIQKIVGDSLINIGFPTGTPRLINIFQLNDKSICFSMEQIHSAVALNIYLETCSNLQFPTIIIDCLLQLSAMVWHLDNVLGINHRDLKPSNLLIVEHDIPIRKIINVDTDILEIYSKHSLTFIDFGFSCLGSTETHISDMSLSTVYSRTDPCPKEGRDMYLFLAFLYIDYHAKLPPKLLTLFESWLNIPGSNLCAFMCKDVENSKKWLYFMAGNDKIKRFNSCPKRIVNDLQAFM